MSFSIIQDKAFKLANEALDASRKDLAGRIDYFYKAQASNFQRRPSLRSWRYCIGPYRRTRNKILAVEPPPKNFTSCAPKIPPATQASEDLEALYAANQLGLNTQSCKSCKYCIVLHHSLLQKKRLRKPTRDETR